jgi:hypothetical protein
VAGNIAVPLRRAGEESTGDSRDDQDAAEHRAYLQRGETRLSTLHRVAGAFLGGAGLLTLLPVLFRDTFSSLFFQLIFAPNLRFPPSGSVQRWLTLLPVTMTLFLPLAALYLLVRDLVQFYFTGHHFDEGATRSITYPRFILSGILVAVPENRMITARSHPAVTDLLVPKSAKARRKLLREAHEIGECADVHIGGTHKAMVEAELQQFVLKYTASLPRSLALESAKMEASLARHHALLRVLVLRYAKAFLLTILTTGTTVTALVILNLVQPSGNLGGGGPVLPPYVVWCGALGVYGGWCFLAAWVVRRPIVWIYRAYGSEDDEMRTPQSLVEFERLTLVIVGISAVTVAACLAWFAVGTSDLIARPLAAFTCLVTTVPALAYVVYTFATTGRRSTIRE